MGNHSNIRFGISVSVISKPFMPKKHP